MKVPRIGISLRDATFIVGVFLVALAGYMAWPPLGPGLPGVVLLFITLRVR